MKLVRIISMSILFVPPLSSVPLPDQDVPKDYLEVLPFFFFFNDTATTEIYTLSLHDALPISTRKPVTTFPSPPKDRSRVPSGLRSEEHTSELQSRLHLVCRLLLEKKKKK